MTARRLIRAVLRPHNRKNAEFGIGRRASDYLLDLAILVGGKTVRAALLDIDFGIAGESGRRALAHRALPAIDSNILRPSLPPSSGSTACSGCGIRPKTLKRSLATPAIARIEPFGFADSLSRPS